MKNIKKKILLIIFAAIAAIALLFIIAFNLFYNRYFENEAKKAIQNEINWNNSATFDMTSSIFNSYLNSYYLPIEDDDEQYGIDNQEGKMLLELALSENVPFDTIQFLNTSDHRYVFAIMQYTFFATIYNGEMVAGNDGVDYEEKEVTQYYVSYVDILPVMSYAKVLNYIFLAILIAVTIVMSLLGMRLGRKIETAQNNQNRFFQNASHELKTPLMSIQGYAEAIQMDVMDHHAAADIIMDESDRMANLVGDILAISKIDCGQLGLTLAPTDLKEVLYDCIQSEQIILEKNNIETILKFTNEKVIVSADDVQLRKAFMNIISNDIRYCKNKLQIVCQKKDAFAVIHFIDDGPGLDKEMREKIFERFYMGEKGQTGIGLALAKEIVQLHNGQIKAMSGKNGGTVFTIKLPL